MKKNKKIIIGVFLLVSIILIILSIGLTSASFCCEKTKITDDGKGGAWCQSVDSKSECEAGFQVSETGCESTTYCKTGCCFNSLDGTCSQNTAQKTCDNAKGVWRENAKCQIPECEYGCCVLSKQGVWGTRTKCDFMASSYGIGIDFRTNVDGEFECNLIGSEEDMGACIYDKTNMKSCKFTTRQECEGMKKIETTTSDSSKGFFGLFGGNKEENQTVYSTTDVNFYKDYLCSAKDSSEISNVCGRSKETTCSNGKVYFVDTCGNLANIYDAAKVNEQSYWEKVISLDNVACDNKNGNVNSKDCGLCDYYAGSTCGIKRSGDVSPTQGDYLCRDLSCKYNGATYKHGERWCAIESDGNKGVSKSLPGSEHFVLKCDNGEVTSEACGDWRNKICVESEIGEITNAQCIINDWKDCIEQTTEKDCENEERRDCLWVETEFGLKDYQTNLKCIPRYAPGFNFWEETSEACSLGSMTVQMTYEKGLLEGENGWSCEKNCWADDENYLNTLNKVCGSLGDCGSSVNYFGQKGWYEIKDLWSKS